MLNILNSKNLSNVLVVVTRYFGGILLGTGGLLRAYTGAVQEALKGATEIERTLGLEIICTVEYQDLEKFKYYLKQNDIIITNLEYSEFISVTVQITQDKLEKLENQKQDLNFKIIDMQILGDKYI